MHAAVGGIVHESSTFATEHLGETVVTDFAVHSGDHLMREFAGTNTVVGGYLSACQEAGVTVVPAVHARAEPAGAVSREAYTRLRDRLLAALCRDCELLLLDLHGAGVIAPDDSLEVDLLRSVREVCGPEPVLAITLDLHANVTAEMCELADIVVGYLEYPHVDMARRARCAAGVAVSVSRRQIPRACSRLTRVPMVLPPSPTDEPAARDLRALAEHAETTSGVLACSVYHGFPYADTPQAGASVVTVTGGAPAHGDAVNGRLAQWLWRHRTAFLPTMVEPAKAVVAASGGRPVVVGDAADNPGGGGSGDGTYLLRAILDGGRPACFATLHDPAAVRQAADAGAGATIDVLLGGRHAEASGPPIEARAVVHAVTDGRVVQQSVRRGKALDFGPCAWLRIGGVDLVVATERRQVFDPSILLLHGIDPAQYPLVAVKSAHHFRSGFADLNATPMTTDSPGLTTRRIWQLGPRGPSARLWPMSAGDSLYEGGCR